MELDVELKKDLGIALNEATLLGAEVHTDWNMVFVTFSVLTLPCEGPPPGDRRIQFVFHPVGRIAASLRMGRWDDPTATVVPFDVEDLLVITQELKQPVYGWDFFDLEKDFTTWEDRLSLDYRAGNGTGMSHSMTLFQEGGDRHLDLRIWFDSFGLRDARGGVPKLEEFIAGGKRWWEAFYNSDPRTDGEGIVPNGRDGLPRIPKDLFK
jgi:hypothetical protein